MALKVPKSLNIRLINTFSFLLGTYSLSFLVNFSEDFMFSGEEQGKIKLTRARKRRCFSSHVQESQRDRVQGSFCISYPNLIFSLLSCSSMSLKLFFFFFSVEIFSWDKVVARVPAASFTLIFQPSGRRKPRRKSVPPLSRHFPFYPIGQEFVMGSLPVREAEERGIYC